MGEKMTLEQMRVELRSFERGRLQPSDWFAYCREVADAIDAHLTQPAQAVDVVECDNCGSRDGCMCERNGIGSGSFLCATCKQPVSLTAALTKFHPTHQEKP